MCIYIYIFVYIYIYEKKLVSCTSYFETQWLITIVTIKPNCCCVKCTASHVQICSFNDSTSNNPFLDQDRRSDVAFQRWKVLRSVANFMHLEGINPIWHSLICTCLKTFTIYHDNCPTDKCHIIRPTSYVPNQSMFIGTALQGLQSAVISSHLKHSSFQNWQPQRHPSSWLHHRAKLHESMVCHSQIQGIPIKPPSEKQVGVGQNVWFASTTFGWCQILEIPSLQWYPTFSPCDEF